MDMNAPTLPTTTKIATISQTLLLVIVVCISTSAHAELNFMKTCNNNYEEMVNVEETIGPDDTLTLPFNCSWKFFILGEFDRWVINVESINLIGQGQSKDCQNNSLTIIDGWERDHEQVFKSCYNTSGYSFTTSGNTALILLTITERNIQDGDLSLNFSVNRFSETQCYGQILTLKASQESKYLTSPGYPDEYYNDLNCQWRIESEDGNEVEIVFEVIDFAFADCKNDYISVYDGLSPSSLRLATECHRSEWKNETPKYRSSGQALYIQFHSDDRNSRGKGFKIRYYTQEWPSDDLVADTSCRENIVNLKATEDSQYLTSMNYPDKYPPNCNCRWILHSYDYDIEVEILDLSVEVNGLCFKDHLDIFRGTDNEVSPMARICDDMAYNPAGTKFRSQGRSMLIQFVSDDSLQMRGWKLRYYTRADPSPDLANVTECRGKIVYLNSTEDKQTLTSAGYPVSYQPLSDCRWQIKADSNNKIEVHIVDMDMEELRSNVQCYVDHVQIFDGPNVSSPIMGRWCEGTKTIQSSGPYLTVQFGSDHEGTGKGFKLLYYNTQPTGESATNTPTTSTDKDDDDAGNARRGSFNTIILATLFIIAVFYS